MRVAVYKFEDDGDDCCCYYVNFSWGSWIVGGVGFLAGAALAAPVVVPVVAGLGFTGAGIAAGSTASWMMSLCGGAVAKGGVVATLQSIGATGAVGYAAKSAGGTAGRKAAKKVYEWIVE